MNILITGVAGFIGSNLADYIVKNHSEHTIIGIDSLFGGYMDNVNEKVIFYKRDLSTQTISDIFEKHKIDYVFHFAAYAAEGLSPFMRKFNYSNNMLSTAEIVNCCIKYGIKRLIYTSSNSVYGIGNNKSFLETDTPKPIDPYGVSKYACEMDIQIAGEQHNLDWCIIRPHNVYGEKQNIWDSYRNVIGIWMLQSLNNQPITIYGNGEQKRAFTYIKNILEPLYKTMEGDKCSKQIFNLGSGLDISIKDLSEKVSLLTNNKNIVYLEQRYEVLNAIPSIEKSIDVLKYTEEFSIDDGLTNMWTWAKKQPKRDIYRWDNYELNKGLYSYWL